MTRKRKSEAITLTEIDRAVYSSFCSSASGLSQLHSQSVNQHKLAFQAGERHALEELYEWMVIKEREGARVTESDVSAYLQSHLHFVEPVMENELQTEPNEKKSINSIHREHIEHHQKEAVDTVRSLESEMDIS